MKWMVKGGDFLLFSRSLIAKWVLAGLFSSFSPCQLGHVLPPVDVCPHIGVYHLVLCVCDAREGVDC